MEIGKTYFNLLHITTTSVPSFGKHVFEDFLSSKSSSIIFFNSLHSSILILSKCGRHLIIEVEKTIFNFSHRMIFNSVRFWRETKFLGPTKRHVILGRMFKSMPSKAKFSCCSLISLRQKILSILELSTRRLFKAIKCSTFPLNSYSK